MDDEFNSAKSQKEFEDFADEESLSEPLDESDADSIGENLMNLNYEVRLAFSRARRQYGGDTWISNELWKAFQMLDQVWDVLQQVYDYDGFLHPSKRKPPEQPMAQVPYQP